MTAANGGVSRVFAVDSADEAVRLVHPPEHQVIGGAMTPGGQSLVTLSISLSPIEHLSVWSWEPPLQQELYLRARQGASPVAMTEDGRHVAFLDARGGLEVLALETPQASWKAIIATSRRESVLSGNGQRFAVAGPDRRVRVYDSGQPAPIFESSTLPAPAALRLSFNGERLGFGAERMIHAVTQCETPVVAHSGPDRGSGRTISRREPCRRRRPIAKPAKGGAPV